MQKYKFSIKNIAMYIFIILILSACSGEEKNGLNYEKILINSLELLKKDPNNCIYLEQIASSYQALNDFELATKFYKRAITQCPNKFVNQFQLGICYYLLRKKELGIQFMDKAITDARNAGDIKLANMFEKEKKDWIKKKNLVKDIDLNSKE